MLGALSPHEVACVNFHVQKGANPILILLVHSEANQNRLATHAKFRSSLSKRSIAMMDSCSATWTRPPQAEANPSMEQFKGCKRKQAFGMKMAIIQSTYNNLLLLETLRIVHRHVAPMKPAKKGGYSGCDCILLWNAASFSALAKRRSTVSHTDLRRNRRNTVEVKNNDTPQRLAKLFDAKKYVLCFCTVLYSHSMAACFKVI